MKRFLAVLVAVIMSVSVMAAVSVTAFAVESPTATTAQDKKPITTINGDVDKDDIRYTEDPNDPYTITFEYTGDGILEGWDENLNDLGLVDGQDYTTINHPDGRFTITFISANAKQLYDNREVIVNAIVKFPTATTGTTSKNNSNKAPETGIATSVVAATVAAAGAGFAVLSASRKRDAE